MPPDLHGLRVLLVGNWPSPFGGVSVHVRALRNAARKAGAHVTVLDIGHGQNCTEGVFPSGSEVPFLTRLMALARSNHVVHVHTSGANPKSWILTTLVGLTARASGCHPLVTFHSGHAPRYLTTRPRMLAARAALTVYDRVICVNQEISKTFHRIGAADDRHVVAPAFGLEGVEPGELPRSARAFFDRHSPVICAMLAHGRDYGADDLFGAMHLLREDLPKVGLIIYGAGTDTPAQGLPSALSDATLSLGEIERSQAIALMQASDMFVRPTLVDGDAVSIREALSVGIRVVATRVGYRPEGIGLCEPGNAVSLARAMRETLDAPPPRELTHGRDGIETVLHVYARFVAWRPALAA